MMRFFFLLTLVIIVSCNTNSSSVELTQDEKSLFLKAADRIFKEMKEDGGYLVSPYYGKFDYSYTNKTKENQKKIFNFNKLDDESFNKARKITKKFNNKFSESLSDLSSASKSNFVLTFSRIYKGMVFANFYRLAKQINIQDINDKSIEEQKNLSKLTEYKFVVLFENTEIKDILLESYTINDF